MISFSNLNPLLLFVSSPSEFFSPWRPGSLQGFPRWLKKASDDAPSTERKREREKDAVVQRIQPPSFIPFASYLVGRQIFPDCSSYVVVAKNQTSPSQNRHLSIASGLPTCWHGLVSSGCEHLHQFQCAMIVTFIIEALSSFAVIRSSVPFLAGWAFFFSFWGRERVRFGCALFAVLAQIPLSRCSVDGFGYKDSQVGIRWRCLALQVVPFFLSFISPLSCFLKSYLCCIFQCVFHFFRNCEKVETEKTWRWKRKLSFRRPPSRCPSSSA